MGNLLGLLIGHVAGNRVVGGYDYSAYCKTIDFESGEIDTESRRNMSADLVGAPLIQIAGIDSVEYLPMGEGGDLGLGLGLVKSEGGRARIIWARVRIHRGRRPP